VEGKKKMKMNKLIFLIFALFSFSAFSVSDTDKEMRKLFEKYEKVMYQQKVELVDEVFTQDFLKHQGGKEAFIAKVKTYPYVKEKKGLARLLQKFKKSKVGKFFTVKAKTEDSKTTNFIIKEEEDGKIKIDGTIGDG
jgi:hypothetical protein